MLEKPKNLTLLQEKGGYMDCDYILIYSDDLNTERSFRFHETTPEKAEIKAREIIKEAQKKRVKDFPFAPPIIEGTLFRGFLEISGEQFIVVKK